LAIVVGVGVIAPLVLPQVSQEYAGNLLETKQGPSWEHLLGTDTLGRDVLDRLLVGTRPVIIGVAEAVIVGMTAGVLLGLAAGYFGGRVDRMLGRATDIMFALPGTIIVLVVLSVFPQSMLAAMVTLGLLATPGVGRLVRAAVLPLREELYVAAARVSGLSRPRIMFRHILPRIFGVVCVTAALLAAGALLAQAGLAFLGLLIAPPAPSWGGMVNDGLSVVVSDPWLLWPPGIVIAITILALSQLGDLASDASTEVWSGPALAPLQRGRAARRRNLPNRSASMSRPVKAGSEGATTSFPTAKSEALLAIQGLSVAFSSSAGDPVRVVDQVSIEISAGETVGIVGESGCGKTATALSILGLLPGTGHIDGGRILFEGRDLTALSKPEMHRLRGREIAMVSQEPMTSLDPAYRIERQLAEVVRRHLRLSRKAAHARVLELLRQVQLPDPEAVARRYPHQLSGGMAQRVAIARALAGEPKLLIADEPTTALDVTVQAEIIDLLRTLQQQRGLAVLLVTHDWGVVADLCARAIVMYAGQVVERAQVEPMFREPLHPYTEALLAANPHHHAIGKETLRSIPGTVPQPGRWPDGCHFHPRCPYATGSCMEQPIALQRVKPGRVTRCIHSDQLAATR
jgi:peptide/nickel transport system permease protein